MPSRSWSRHPIVEFKRWRAGRHTRGAAAETERKLPLREFVYLDAVSLHSLLVSQNATIPSEVSRAISRADEAELTGTVATKIGSDAFGGSASAETSARYQTTNSNSSQSSRKAVIQTLFKELRELPLDFKLAACDELPAMLKNSPDIATATDRCAVKPASDFTRGALVEVEVTLAVDPVFKLGAMMNEWTAMAGDFPEMFGSQDLFGFLHDAQPIMKVLDRFLAGLIPIKATATNHVVAEVDGKEYVVHKAAIDGMSLETRPLFIVGVTEHLSYWKDIRRVLFSGARFTVLGRIAREGIHRSWTPVKLADLFSEVAPDFVDQINAIRSPLAGDGDTAPQQTQQRALSDALHHYKEALTGGQGDWAAGDEQVYQALVRRLAAGATDAVAQRRAFDQVRESVRQALQVELPTPDADLRARQEARVKYGLELFPPNGIDYSGSSPQGADGDRKSDERMLDTEVIAIYW